MMKTKRDWFPVALGILCGFLAALLLLAMSNYGAYAEALPGTALDGDLELAYAETDLTITDCLRVNVKAVNDDGAWADLTLPYVPPSIRYVLLFDGTHLIHGGWEQVDNTIRLHFLPDDLAALDGTVGLYLLIVSDIGGM